MTELAHSALGASSAARWMTCPGSYRACLSLPPSPPTVYSAEGTEAHRVAETALRQAGVEMQGPIAPAMWQAAETYALEVRARWKAGCLAGVEARVSLAGWWGAGETPPPVELFGTADAWVFDPRLSRLSVIDFKYGAGVFVSANDNPQLLYYAAGAMLTLAGMSSRARVRDVEMVIVQPRAKNMQPVRTSTLDALDVRRWVANDLKPAVRRVMDLDAPFVAGPHCRFCTYRRHGCPAWDLQATASAQADFLNQGEDEP